MAKEYQIEYGDELITFNLAYSNRNNIAIEVSYDRPLLVTVPFNTPIEKTLEKVRQKGKWISKQKRQFSSYEKVERQIEYVSGETVFYLGRKYRLKVIKSVENNVKLYGKFLHVYTPDKVDFDKIKKQVDAWYKEKAIEKLTSRVDFYKYVAQRENVELNKVYIRQLLKRWGSCSKNNSISLNVELVKLPIQCIDYVIVHEMCHLKYLNHGAKFYNILTKYMPDWGKRKDRLNMFYSG